MSALSAVASRLRELTTFRRKAIPGVSSVPNQWVTLFGETMAGMWQRGVRIEDPDCLLAFSAIYACIDLISADVSTLAPLLVMQQNGLPVPVDNPAFSPVLRRPNRYQNRIQFLSYWMVCKLIWGNTYVLKERDNRNVVVALYILDPRLVRVLVAQDGGVYYQIGNNTLTNAEGPITVPASEVIHDRAICPFHPLIGMGPLHAAAVSATQGRKIQSNSSIFFENLSRPSGQLTSPDEISDETADRLKRDFEERFSGSNIGRLLVSGSGLKYEPMTMPAQQSQLIEQLGWTGEDCCRPYHVPAYKVGLGAPPTFNNIGQLAQDYYDTCLRPHVTGIELLLTEGLALPSGLSIEMDLSDLLRMDPLARSEYAERLSKGGVISPDEARAIDRRQPLPNGVGALPYLQQQMFPINVLAKRTDVTPPAANAPAPVPPAAPAAPAEPTKQLIEVFIADDVEKLEALAEERSRELFWRLLRIPEVEDA